MRRFLPFLLLLAAPGIAFAQADAAPQPVRVTKGHVSVTCKFGAANVPSVAVGLTFGKDVGYAFREIPLAFADAGFTLIPTVPGIYETRPMARWPDTLAASPYISFPHPGVVASLVVGMTKKDSVAVFGIVDALCASAPGAPDSTVTEALALAQAQLQQALEAHRPH